MTRAPLVFDPDDPRAPSRAEWEAMSEAERGPDILAVLDVESHERSSWIVSREGRGLDLVIDIHVGGDSRKDFEANVARHSGLGIREYFLFDQPNARMVKPP